MSVITISRSACSGGKEIAEAVADRMGYGCISDEIILQASREHDVPETKLATALHDAPSILEHFVNHRERCLAYIHEALFSRVRLGDVVYHGLAGHFLLGKVFQVLKVRICADLEHRVEEKKSRDGVSTAEAHRILFKEDDARRRWSIKHYGIDQMDASLYDLMINVTKISKLQAVGIICHLADADRFQTTPEGQKAIDDLALVARVRARVVVMMPDTEIHAEDGVVTMRFGASRIRKEALLREAEMLVGSIPGVKEVRVKTFQMPLFHE